ncbi:bifunctional 2-polyprenyl-6-hydroxyphenol methylase/3-demethylubiquinol 3-O-methyltransferase UbiG [Catenovulum sp. 2E275]|uniref:bifunctional 2-polyprenyl-6-hydroxyphenol methylase/3-demethylubiquinol 3-O-methyltransferase UbiG n=1 Tax=Catenovulum sp. 2E275 TaxID=2980497 RepID=UPI0021CF32DC|nr:bifunctional 2-polyprenyl-6-hydroxyphenol methylase/3-demethylubiquinol 3-O-methyltransferase UbiG [Catenovulum sp. 2E275]MCU4674486.1 bifunctional 2-polyprenyl-6-hydroxyphenol methylase/3-demethylubiquinol 3-O-methyltransferase UbiG [Catenovulum sp. 2E275]
MSNIDQTEVDKFNQIAHLWWDLNGEFAPLHLMNPTRVNYIAEHAGGLFGKQVLDVGCGGGILSEALAKQGAQVTGLDAAPDSIDVAKLHAKADGLHIDYLHTTIEPYAQTHPAQFDIVTCLEMLEHVPDPKSVIQACCELVKPGGYLFASTLNRSAKGYLLGIVAAEYLLNIVPKGTHDFNKFLRPSELINMIEACGLKVTKLNGIHFNPLTKSFKVNSDPGVNYILCAQKI